VWSFVKKMKGSVIGLGCFILFVLGGCQSNLPLLENAPHKQLMVTNYKIAPNDTINLVVWHNPELNLTLPVRPDGFITLPLIGDIYASSKTSSELSDEIKTKLGGYIRDPDVTVMIMQFVGNFSDNIRIIGEAAKPQAIPYRQGMTVLDAIIIVGGITEFADGNRAKLVRVENNRQARYRVRLDDLIQKGDIAANAPLYPGDVIIIPEAFF
jgi:polysaccharide export outer membrane protein